MISSPRGTPRTKSLRRAVQLLQAVASRPAGSSASALARTVGLPRSTVARTLRTLADAGFVEEAPGSQGWTLGYELVRLARAADPYRHLVQVAEPPLRRLRDSTAESALLGAPRGAPGMEILLQLDPDRHVGVANWVGAEVPLHVSAAGKLVLAELEQDDLEEWLAVQELTPFTPAAPTQAQAVRAELARVRRQGWAETVDELEEGLAALSVPIRDRAGTLTGMVGISGPTFRLTRARRHELLDTVRATAADIERVLATDPNADAVRSRAC